MTQSSLQQVLLRLLLLSAFIIQICYAPVILLPLSIFCLILIKTGPVNAYIRPQGVRNVFKKLSALPQFQVIQLTLSTLFLSYSLLLLIHSAALDLFRVQFRSMTPVLRPGDTVLVDKTAPGPGLPLARDGRENFTRITSLNRLRHNDIIVFRSPVDGRILIKRLIALPFDKVSYSGRKMTVNSRTYHTRTNSFMRPDNPPGARPPEEIAGKGETAVQAWYHGLPPEVYVPAECYVVLGDNTVNSHDSRHWGFVPYEAVIGRVIFSNGREQLK